MENLKTKVTVNFTLIKAYSPETDKVKDFKVVGKLNVSEAKEYSTDNNHVYISKENLKETFNVNTISLIQLREDN